VCGVVSLSIALAFTQSLETSSKVILHCYFLDMAASKERGENKAKYGTEEVNAMLSGFFSQEGFDYSEGSTSTRQSSEYY
jgi:hypothetical protein